MPTTAKTAKSLVRRAREAANLSLLELYQRTGIDPSSISRIERGLAKPSAESALKLWTALGRQPELLPAILGEEPQQSEGA